MQNLRNHLQQSLTSFLRRWNCETGNNYGKIYIRPMEATLTDFETRADKVMQSALTLNEMLARLEKEEGIY